MAIVYMSKSKFMDFFKITLNFTTDIESMKYARIEKGCLFDINTSNYAALNGHLDCLQYLYESGCPMNEQTLSNAALNGHI
jgi:hypothetical protein